MAWYRSGTVTASVGQNVITGTRTQWANNVMGVAPGQALVVQRSDGNTLIYEILAVDSNTKIRINGNVVDALSAANYGIQTSVANSYSALARETSAQLALYQQLLQDWQQITTGTGSVSIIAPDGSTVVIPSLAQLSRIGIGLPTQADMANFDWQNFVFTSGANYVTSYNTWVNPPAGITYNAGTRVSIRVIYISTTSGPRMGLELTPDTGAAANFKVYKLLCVGAAGSRVFTVREEWNSANPIPISGGGTGATTAAGALVNLGLGEGSLIPIGVPLPYPLATAPTGYLKCNGSSFSTTTYPQLAVAYPSGVLPDLRGEFIRGWDDGRRVDSGRVVLTGQSQSVQKHTHGLAMAYSSESGYKDRLGASPNTDMIPIKDMTNVTTFTGSGEYYLKANDSTGVETRPRNVAFNYIVRAL